MDPNPKPDASQAATVHARPDSTALLTPIPVVSTARVGDIVAGKYQLLHRIAEGAMGTVWGARNLTLDVVVAIKIVHPYVRYPFVAPALLWEAQAACRLSNPAIVRVYDFGRMENGDTFIVMEYLVGETLRALLTREGRLSPELAVKLMLPIADALDAAHAQGIVHRDLKPENVVLVTDHFGRVQPKLIDFGIAKLSWVTEDWVAGATVVGTPGYMPLEQVSGDEIDERADVWAFSATLFELIVGELPFDPSGGMPAALHSLRHSPMPLLSDHTHVDDELWRIVERGLHRHVADRWPTIDALRDALSAWLGARPPSSMPPRSRPVSLRYRAEILADGPPSSASVSGAAATSLVIPLARRIDRKSAAPESRGSADVALPEPDDDPVVEPKRSPVRRIARWTVAASVAGAGFLGTTWGEPHHIAQRWVNAWTARAAAAVPASLHGASARKP